MNNISWEVFKKTGSIDAYLYFCDCKNIHEEIEEVREKKKTMIILNTQGIVLKAIRYKESDIILTLFTRKLGKVSAIAKGAKKIRALCFHHHSYFLIAILP